MSRVKAAIEKAKASHDARLLAQPNIAATPDDTAAVVDVVRHAAARFNIGNQPPLTPQQRGEKFIIDADMADHSIEESVMAIRAAVLRRTSGTACKLLVTPTIGRSGNRFVSLNLAAAFASDIHMSSILVNCNLKRTASAYSDLSENTFGLSDYLSTDGHDVKDMLTDIGIERLRLIDAGTNVQQQRTFLTSSRFRQIFGPLQESYPDTYMIFDAPPAPESSDTRILVDECDLVVLVAEYGESSEQSVRESIELIGKEKLLGVVLNNEPKWPFGV